MQRQSLEYLNPEGKTQKVTEYFMLKTMCAIDCNIYRTNGSLRITDQDTLYRIGLKTINVVNDFVTKECIKALNTAKSQQKGQQESDTKKRVEQFLKDQKLDGWSFRSAKNMNKFVTVDLNRKHQASSKCCVCSGTHDRDAYLYLRLTPSKVTVHCRKATFAKQE